VVLRWTCIGEERLVTCQNCGFIADRMRPRPATIEELRARAKRERRLANRRRNFIVEPLDPAERRVRGRRVKRRIPI
jgi:hypothetical protein